MAQDDMHVIMYKVLTYLYECMKRGKDPDKEMLQSYGPLFGGVPERYWTAIWLEMADKGFVMGIVKSPYDNAVHVVVDSPRVTFEGVEFLNENSMMAKAKEFLKETKSIIPFV